MSHLIAPLEDVLVAVAQGAVDVEELDDAVLPHVLGVPPRLLPAQRRALRQQPHAGPNGGSGAEPNGGGAGKKEEEEEVKVEDEESGACGVHSAPRRRRREPRPAPHVTAAARQAVTQHFPPTGPAPGGLSGRLHLSGPGGLV